MNKTIIYVLLVAFSLTLGCKGSRKVSKKSHAKPKVQEETTTDKETLGEILLGLHFMTDEERNGLEITIGGEDLPAYNETGNKLVGTEILAYLKDKSMTYDLYSNDKLEPKAAVFRPEMTKLPDDDLPPMEVELEYAPAFSKKDMSGKTVTLEELKGKVVVINFWFTRCNPCVQEIPDLNAIVKKYKEKDVVFLGITQDPSPKVARFLDKYPFDYTLITDAQDVMDRYIVLAYPTNIVLDKKGDIMYHSSGYRHQIDKILSKYIDKGLKS